MQRLVNQTLRALDRRLAALWLRTRREHPALLAFAFHQVFADTREVAHHLVDPYQPVVLSDLRRFIEYFLQHGYRFLAPADLLAHGADGSYEQMTGSIATAGCRDPTESGAVARQPGRSALDPAGRYALLTFDDGYANNLRALPLLRELGVPATLFVSTRHVAEGHAFWWDAVYRERRRRGSTAAAIGREKAALQRRSYGAIEAYVRTELGPGALRPCGDTDRPLTPAELKALASEPLITLGNHTTDHAILTRHDDDTVHEQIRGCQDYLAELTGTVPAIIAYPIGAHDARVVRLARSAGLRLGVTAVPGKNQLPLSADARMRIARYCLSGGDGLLADCRRCRSDLQLRHLRRWLSRGQ